MISYGKDHCKEIPNFEKLQLCGTGVALCNRPMAAAVVKFVATVLGLNVLNPVRIV